MIGGGLKISLGACALALWGPAAWAEANSAAALTEKLTQHYKPVRPGTAGAKPKLLTVRQPGILGIAAADAHFLDSCPTIFRSGRIHQLPGYFCSQLAAKSQKKLLVAERVYVTNILVSLAFDRISFYLAACGACAPDTEPAFRSLVVFEFSKGYLAKAAVAEIVQTVDRVFAAQDAAADAPEPVPPEPVGAGPATPAEPAPNAPAAAAAAAPPAADAAIVRKGQTPGEVEKILGKPLAIIDLGTKLVYVYPNMKLLYVGGKLADVQ
ncbi:MAG: hypothetical protein LAP87_18795 [Acidobacteriia bacterium]|nr:hypothetical protein [Terriglobia bacterium]